MRRTAISAATSLLAFAAAMTLPAVSADAADRLVVEVVSSRPDAVSGGDARVRVEVPAAVDPASVRLRVDGRDLTGDLEPADGGLEGVVDGLREGRSTLWATAPGAAAGAVNIVNHPQAGPVFAGPHEQPFVCQTHQFRTAGGSLLGPPLDENCSVETRTEYVYRTTAGSFKPLADPADRPADLAWTTPQSGERVPFVVEVETGTINRGVYETAVLYGADDTGAAWNGKLIYTFGGGCRSGWYVQGRNTGGVLVPSMLERGYAVGSNSLNVFGVNCNDLLAAETFAMTREHFIEEHGRPIYTMGWGCSGGSYQSHQIADNYPGLLDGILVGCSFADVGFDTSQKLADSRLLHHYLTVTAPGALSEQQQLAVTGFPVPAALASMSNGANRLDPDAEFDSAVPAAARYDADTNPDGARATIWDHTVNAYGEDRRTGFARQPIDNVGVQYGLEAVRDGAISVDQFLDLNARVGGLDADAEHTAARSSADPVALDRAYATGRMLSGGGGLGDIPIVDYRAYTDLAPGGDIHMRYHSFAVRERLVGANGDADNQVMLQEDDAHGLFNSGAPVVVEAMDQLDEWILRVQQTDPAPDDRHDAVVDAKPAQLVDACWTSEGEKISEPQTYDGPGRCNELYPSHASPRIVAGGPVASNIAACALRPVDPGEYGTELSADQRDRLQAIFPTGVCDWTAPGRGSRPLAGTWLFFGDEPGRYRLPQG
ncbi:MAG: DUF6351 family protein [Nocardioidaceae bacterium]